ncbi:MAG: hypothetical protein WA005_04210 [Candidatus Binataceae bacterium]
MARIAALVSLLLIAATPSPTPRPITEGQAKDTGSRYQTPEAGRSQSQPTVLGTHIESVPLQTASASPTAEGYDQERSYIRLGLAVNGVLAVATLILAIVGIYQARSARVAAEQAKRQAETLDATLAETRKAADAAKQSAEIAHATLQGNRPLLVVTKLDLSGFRRPPVSLPPEQQAWGDWVLAYFTIRNAGVSPAIIESAVAALDIWPKEELPPIANYTECKPLFIPDTVLKPDETQRQLIPFKQAYLADFEFDALARLKSWLVLYGLILYRGLLGKNHEVPFETPFLWIWQLTGIQVVQEGTEPKKGFFYRGPADRNRNT